jgi:hypothetical protein
MLERVAEVLRDEAMVDLRMSPEACRDKAEHCLALADKTADRKQKAAWLKFADWWIRLAEYVSVPRSDPSSSR